MTRDLLLLRPLAAFGDLALLTARLLTGSFLIHGVLDNILSRARMAEFSDFLPAHGLAAPDSTGPLPVWAQFAIGIALILGLLTRWAGLLLALNFTVGVVMVHLAQGFREIWPAAVLIALGLLFATLGAGRIALDRLLERTS